MNNEIFFPVLRSLNRLTFLSEFAELLVAFPLDVSGQNSGR